MSTSQENRPGAAVNDGDPSLEVVADQSPDGTFEIRVTRGSAASEHETTPPVRSSSPSASVGAVSGARSGATNPVWIAAVAGGVAVLGMAAFLLRQPTEFEPPPMPEPVEREDFEVFRIEMQPVPTVRNTALFRDAGIEAASGTAEGSAAAAPGEAYEQPFEEQPAGEFVPALDEQPVLDDVTRTQLREIRVEAPTLVEVPTFDPPAVGE